MSKWIEITTSVTQGHGQGQDVNMNGPPDSKMSRWLGPAVNPNRSGRIYDQNSNPLLIEEIANHVLSYLDSSADLESCFDVCQLWRSLVPAHNIRIRPIRSRVTIQDDLSDDKLYGAYVASISKHPSFKATKFTFSDGKLTLLLSPPFQKFVADHAGQIMELEVWNDMDNRGSKYSRGWISQYTTSHALVELLNEKIPKLKTLIIKHFPFWWRANAEFHIDRNGNHNQQLFMKALTKLVITTGWIICHYGSTTAFLSRLFAATPQLEEFQLMRGDEKLGFRDSRLGESAVEALIDTRRLDQIKSLEFFTAQVGCLHLLATHLTLNQLTTLRITNIIYERIGGAIAFVEVVDCDLLQKLLNEQSGSLKHLELSELSKIKPEKLILPPMPNLIELKLGLASSPGFPVKLAYNYGVLNYAEYFPRLRVLGLSGLLQNYSVDEIYPDPDTSYENFSSTVAVLQKIPLGVDAAIMSRIGRLFPNLKIIRIAIPFEQEGHLVSIWKFCSNITELFLTSGSDEEDGTISTAQQGENSAQNHRSLDSVFSGISEAECCRLRWLPAVPADELKLELAKLKMNEPSLRDLKQLRRFCIDGQARFIRDTPRKPSATPDTDPAEATSASGAKRQDGLSSVFGYSTLAKISEQLVFFQASLQLVEMTRECVQHVCEENRLERVNGDSLGFDPNAVRLIKTGLGFEQLDPVLPAEWYGH